MMILDLKSGGILRGCGQNGIGRQLKPQESACTALERTAPCSCVPAPVESSGGVGLRCRGGTLRQRNPSLCKRLKSLHCCLVCWWDGDWDSGRVRQ